MAHVNFPKGAGLGRDSNRRKPSPVDYEWTMQHGSRAQRREIVRQLKVFKRQGHPEAEGILRELTAGKVWLVCLSGREPFRVICPQRATAAEVIAQWPGAVVKEVGHD